MLKQETKRFHWLALRTIRAHRSAHFMVHEYDSRTEDCAPCTCLHLAFSTAVSWSVWKEVDRQTVINIFLALEAAIHNWGVLYGFCLLANKLLKCVRQRLEQHGEGEAEREGTGKGCATRYTFMNRSKFHSEAEQLNATGPLPLFSSICSLPCSALCLTTIQPFILQDVHAERTVVWIPERSKGKTTILLD